MIVTLVWDIGVYFPLYVERIGVPLMHLCNLLIWRYMLSFRDSIGGDSMH